VMLHKRLISNYRTVFALFHPLIAIDANTVDE